MKTISLSIGEDRVLASAVRIADTFAARAIGLLRTPPLKAEDGLLLIPGGSVHTFGMRYSVDVVFLDRRMRVLGVSPCVAPRRICLAPPRCAHVLELQAGRIRATGLLIGAYVFVSDSPALDATPPQTAERPCANTRPARQPIQFTLRLPPSRPFPPSSPRT